MVKQVIIKDIQHIIKAVGLSAVVTVIFTSFSTNLIIPIAHKIIPDLKKKKEKRLSFKNVSRSFLEAILTLVLFLFLYEIFLLMFIK